MKNILITFLLLSLIVPSVAFAQQSDVDSLNIDLSQVLDQFNIQPSEGNLEGVEVPDNPTNLLNIFRDLFDLSGGVFSLVRNIIAQVDTFLLDTIGISVAELVKSLVVATINIMKVIVEILGSLLAMI